MYYLALERVIQFIHMYINDLRKSTVDNKNLSKTYQMHRIHQSFAMSSLLSVLFAITLNEACRAEIYI